MPQEHIRTSHTAGLGEPESNDAREYTLGRRNLSGVQTWTDTIFADTPALAEIQAAAHLEISYPLQLESFKDKGSTFLKDSSGTQIFPPPGNV
jgi:hypothetical protein